MDHAKLRYILHKMGRVKSPSCRKRSEEKETSVHIPCEYPVLERVRSFPWQGPDRTAPNKKKRGWTMLRLWVKVWGCWAAPWNECRKMEGNGLKILTSRGTWKGSASKNTKKFTLYTLSCHACEIITPALELELLFWHVRLCRPTGAVIIESNSK